ncbi:MAG: flagellar basal body-associated FliL family protein [Limnochordia bacterium]|nr:flagellar basal body-associated FliL family protein [Limnochordia bacterium]MDD2629263.1 flagellar basal body-associated FliL family protein [Limnochordia bacterium]MDD4517267.1 flagellar basal body-associated FliL family protein [Limnochordia bacterium]
MAETNKTTGRWGFIVLIVCLAVGVTVGSALFTYYLIQGKVPLPAFAKKEADKMGPMVKFDELVLNFGPPERHGYVRFRPELELYEAKGVKIIDDWMPAIQNEIILYIRDCTIQDFGTSASLRRVADDLVDKLNNLLPSPQIARLYFVGLVIQ